MSLPPAIWCARAWLGAQHLDHDVLLHLDGAGTITSIESPVPRPPGVVALSGWVVPGMRNDHSHAFHRALRGRTHAGSDSFWSWRDRMYAIAATLTPDSYEDLATAVYAEMLLSGYTHVTEFHYLHHGPGGERYADPNAMSRALMQAAATAGISMTLLDTLYLSSAPGQPPRDVQRRFSDGDAAAWADRTALLGCEGLVDHGLAVHSVRAVPPHAIAAAAELADQRGVLLHAHVSEQVRENEECEAAYGVTPVRLLHDAGALGPRFTAVHATHLGADDIALLAGSRVCLCPSTEAELADGIGPARALSDAGSSLSIGSDSHAVIDPLLELRSVEWDQRLASGRRGSFGPRDLMAIGTSGPLRPGVRADLVEYAPESVRLVGSGPDDLGMLVFSGSAADVRTVIVAGRTVVSEGAHLAIDVAARLESAVTGVWGGAS